MSYNIASSATITTAASNYIIADDTYVENPDYKILGMEGGGSAAVYSNMTVSSGGTARLSAGAVLSGATIEAGGSLYFVNGASAYGLTVKSGGYATGAAWAQTYAGLTLESGAKLSVQAGTLNGRNNNIKKGTLTGNATIASDTVDGVLYGVTQTGAAINYNNVVLSNYVNNGGFTYIRANTSAYYVSAIKAAKTGVGLTGGYLVNAQITNGYLWLHDQANNTAMKLGGANTNITKGHIYHCNADGTSNNDQNMYAADGVLYGVTIKNSGTWLRNLQIFEGLTVSAPTVSSGGSLTVGSGGRGVEVTVSTGGKAIISANGTIATANVEGTLEMWDNATVSALVVKNGGLASMGNVGGAFRDGLTVEAGGHLYIRACNFSGAINVAAGTLSGNLSVASDSIDGVAYGITQTAGAQTYMAGAIVSNYINNGACYTYIGKGGQIRNGSALKNNGGFGMASNGYLYNAWISGGSLWIQHQTGAPVSLGGAETYIKQGQVYHCAANGTTNHDTEMYAEDGVLYGVRIINSGSWLRNLTVLEGLTISAPVVRSGGSLTVGSGGIGSDVTVEVNGRIIVSGATVNGVTVSGGNVTGTVNHAHFSAGAIVTDLNIYGNRTDNQYIVAAYDNAVVSKVYQSGGGLWVYNNATIKELNVEKAEAVFQDNAYGSDIKVSGASAFLYVRNSAVIENLHMSGAQARFQGSAGVVRNAVFEGSIDRLNISNGFLIESASFDSSAALTVSSGGSVNSATINSHAVILVSSNGKMTNVQVNGDDWDGRLRIYDGGYVSGATISGTAGTKNYVSMYDGQGVLEDALADKAGVYLASGGIIRNLTMRNGAATILRGENPYASGATVLGGTLYFQNGAKGENVVVNGGNMYINDDGYAAAVKGSGAKVSGADLIKGTITVSAGAKLFDLRASGGTVTVASTGSTYGVPLLSGATLTGGTLNLNAGAAASSVKIDSGGTIFAYNATLEDFDIETPTRTGGAQLNISGATMIASGGRINGKTNIGVMNLTGGAKFNEAYVSGGSVFLSGLATITNVEQTGGAVILRGEESYVSGATVLGGTLHVQNGGKGDDITIAGGSLSVQDTNMTNPAGSAEIVNDVDMTAGGITIGSGGTVNTINATGGKLTVNANAVANDVTVGEGASATVAGTMNVATSAWNVTVNNGGIVNLETNETLVNAKTNTGAHINFVENKAAAAFAGDQTTIAEGTLYQSGAAIAGHAANGVLEGFNADGSTVGYKLSIGSGIVLKDAVGNNKAVRVSAFDGAVVSGMTLRKGAIICVDGANVQVLDTVLTGEDGTCNLNLSAGAYASNTVVQKGAKIQFQHADGRADNTTIMAGGSMVTSNIASDGTAKTGDLITLDFTGATVSRVYIDSLSHIADETEVVLKGEVAGTTYTIATVGATDKYINCGDWGLYDDSIKAGESITNAFTGMTYDFAATGTQIAVSEFTAATQATAGSIAGGTTIGANGKAAKWTQNTTAEAGASYTAATSDISTEAWLEIDGTNLGGTTLFGADAGYTGTVNLYATGDATINNLAAGAAAGGSVAGVKLTVDSATVGLAYAGGFGTVTGETETLIGEGATMQKDFYAGALANYAKTNTATNTGNVSLTIEDGEFSGNIYGAASVKAGAATSLVHSVGDVTITVKDGESKKGNQACLFAGGYATGTAASDTAVYTVGNIDVTIDGGSWGTVAGGRGIFGGAFASQVTAATQDVSLTINGGSFGNVYGGGWAQKGGVSIVGDVYIDITGGTIANVFGGGTHSVDGAKGTTVVDDVAINVSGGNITGAIYAGGQLDGDTVAGDVISVNFTGDSDFGCGVYGYSYGGGAIGDASLFYTAYVGTFSGKIGGFVGITLDDDTAMTLSTAAADVSNGKWEFDFTDRDAELAGTSFLTWDNADFAGDTVRVNFTDATQAASEWSIATAAFDATTTFTLAIGGADVTTVAYDTAIADGDWAGWKFTDENGTLKFKQLA